MFYFPLKFRESKPTFFTVQACVAFRAHTQSIDANAAVLALQVALAHLFYHLTALPYGGIKSIRKGQRSLTFIVIQLHRKV